MRNNNSKCFLCKLDLDNHPKEITETKYIGSTEGWCIQVSCKRCKYYQIDYTIAKAKDCINNNKLCTFLSYKSSQYNHNSHKNDYFIVDELIKEYSKDLTYVDEDKIKLPSNNDMWNSIIYYIGNNFNSAYEVEKKPIDAWELSGFVGINIKDMDKYMILTIHFLQEMKKEDLISGDTGRYKGSRYLDISLTRKGWKEYDKINAGITEINKVFMAMQFGGEVQEKLYPVLKLLLETIGYELNYIGNNNTVKAGNITNQIAYEIKNSKFVIVDLSDGNRGAYWESGFASGLGKQVFYLCDKEIFDDETQKKEYIHFDVDQHQIILYDKKDLQSFTESNTIDFSTQLDNSDNHFLNKLKYAIKNTII